VPKTLDLLIANLHEIAERIRTHEKEVMHSASARRRCRAKRSSPPSRKMKPGWNGWMSRFSRQKVFALLADYRDGVLEAQQRLQGD
jgi:RNA polymerase primary sigma factor